MYFLFVALICLACIVAMAFFGGGAIAGGMYLNQRLFGAPDDYGAFDFEQRDPAALKEFVLKCVLAAAAAAAVTLIIGFLIGGSTYYFRPRYRHWMLTLLLLVLFAGSVFASLHLVFKQEPKRTAVATAAASLMFVILAWAKFIDLMTI